jgi:ribosomal protein S27AE
VPSGVRLNGEIVRCATDDCVCAGCGSEIFFADLVPCVRLACGKCFYHRQCYAEHLIACGGRACCPCRKRVLLGTTS